jgi:hypothetical protein
VGGFDDCRQSRAAGGAEALEAGQLRLDADAGRAGGVDRLEAVALDGLRREFRGASGSRAGLDRARPQSGRVGVEAKHDLAAALLYECCKPVGEPLAWAFAHL